jgi:large subunit ribosomal protein L15
MKLNSLFDNLGARPSKKRLGRGIGSTKGTRAGRGNKGQKARSGTSGIKGVFEGGQTPLYRRLAKDGFVNIFSKKFVEISLEKLEKAIADGRIAADKVIDIAALKSAKLVNRTLDGLKVLGNGTISKSVKIEAANWTKSAEAAIVKAGGSIARPAKKAADKSEKKARPVKKPVAKKAK